MSKELKLDGHAGRTATLGAIVAPELAYVGDKGLDYLVNTPGSAMIMSLGVLVAFYVCGDRIYQHYKNNSLWIQKYFNKN